MRKHFCKIAQSRPHGWKYFGHGSSHVLAVGWAVRLVDVGELMGFLILCKGQDPSKKPVPHGAGHNHDTAEEDVALGLLTVVCFLLDGQEQFDQAVLDLVLTVFSCFCS